MRAENAGHEFVPDFGHRRGPHKMPVKIPVPVGLDADMIEAFNGDRPGWQPRINEALREHVAQRGIE